jgi:hypothetical protein
MAPLHPRRLAAALRALPILFALGLGASTAGCGAVFPEVATRMTPAPVDVNLDPPPPQDRHFIVVRGATLPSRTRDGREWDKVFGSLPDPYVKIFVNDAELFRTTIESDTLEPKWNDTPKANWPLKVGDRLHIEIWDNNPLIDHPIGQKDVRVDGDFFSVPEQEFDFEGGGELHIAFLPAKAAWGVGFWFELRTGSAYITRVLDGSPASRAGLKGGDRIVQLAGKNVSALSSDDVSGLLNSIPAAGILVGVQHEDGSTLQVKLKEGPMYVLFKEYGEPDKPHE